MSCPAQRRLPSRTPTPAQVRVHVKGIAIDPRAWQKQQRRGEEGAGVAREAGSNPRLSATCSLIRSICSSCSVWSRAAIAGGKKYGCVCVCVCIDGVEQRSSPPESRTYLIFQSILQLPSPSHFWSFDPRMGTVMPSLCLHELVLTVETDFKRKIHINVLLSLSPLKHHEYTRNSAGRTHRLRARDKSNTSNDTGQGDREDVHVLLVHLQVMPSEPRK